MKSLLVIAFRSFGLNLFLGAHMTEVLGFTPVTFLASCYSVLFTYTFNTLFIN